MDSSSDSFHISPQDSSSGSLQYSHLSSLDNSSENIIAAVHYDPEEEYVSDKPKIPKEKFVRLMSLDPLQIGRESIFSSSSESLNFNVCNQFCDLVSFAEYFLDEILDEAEGYVNEDTKTTPTSLRRMPSVQRVERRQSDYFPVIDYARPKFSSWPTIGEFTIELGADKIDEYLSSFSTDEEWLYIIYYLGVKADHSSKFYEYEATWSLPSPEYPIAQATASVFFTVEVSEVLPLACLVTVTFTFESFQFKHTPGITDFSEEWLNYILDSKIGVFKTIKY